VKISGANCLSPMVLRKEIAEVPVGEVLEVITNDSCAREDIRVWCKFTGNELVSVEEMGEGYPCPWQNRCPRTWTVKKALYLPPLIVRELGEVERLA